MLHPMLSVMVTVYVPIAIPVIVSLVDPVLHRYVYPPHPPVAVTYAVPSLAPKHEMVMASIADAESGALGPGIVMFAASVHPLASVTVTT